MHSCADEQYFRIRQLLSRSKSPLQRPRTCEISASEAQSKPAPMAASTDSRPSSGLHLTA